jgi:hypothetical protein
MSSEKSLPYETLTPDMLARFIFEISEYQVNKADIQSRIEYMMQKQLIKLKLEMISMVDDAVEHWKQNHSVENYGSVHAALEGQKESIKHYLKKRS